MKFVLRKRITVYLIFGICKTKDYETIGTASSIPLSVQKQNKKKGDIVSSVTSTCDFQISRSCLRGFDEKGDRFSHYSFFALSHLDGLDVVHLARKRGPWNRFVAKRDVDLVLTCNNHGLCKLVLEK